MIRFSAAMTVTRGLDLADSSEKRKESSAYMPVLGFGAIFGSLSGKSVGGKRRLATSIVTISGE